MKYYVVSDIHGFYSILKRTLEENGFFRDTEPHKLIVCGDLFDRGKEAYELQKFIFELMERDEVILIRGNHEDLLLQMLEDMLYGVPVLYSHHQSNGTVSTVKQLLRRGGGWFTSEPETIVSQMRRTPVIRRIIPSMYHYYETKNYVFVHGWIPCRAMKTASFTQYAPNPDWRYANEEEWSRARWINGMDAAYQGVTVYGKTVVCGHWHCSYGHSRYHGRGEEIGANSDFSPYYDNGIIAIDACTVYSRRINCLVIEDDPLV